MIDINELRRLAQEATPGPWKMLPIGYGRQKFAVADSEFLSILTVTDEGEATFGTMYDDADAKFIAAANPATINELLDRLEAAESEALEEARLNGMGSEREAALMAKLEVAENERDNLRAKIEAMENQEPVKIQHRVPFVNSNGELVGYSVWIDGRGFDHWPHRSLYTLPGAKGEEK